LRRLDLHNILVMTTRSIRQRLFARFLVCDRMTNIFLLEYLANYRPA